ncbi:hypothetical protein EYF80_007999 [Liparis tanakae]|uniref:Uncharacterized protein n=1 Tax=Liparis tanakae TaxID=230148 RepID=A0A4Z2IV63_9TELE|nr:hypothetical protein EYF80_007999 [Liparis tanakae]
MTLQFFVVLHGKSDDGRLLACEKREQDWYFQIEPHVSPSPTVRTFGAYSGLSFSIDGRSSSGSPEGEAETLYRWLSRLWSSRIRPGFGPRSNPVEDMRAVTDNKTFGSNPRYRGSEAKVGEIELPLQFPTERLVLSVLKRPTRCIQVPLRVGVSLYVDSRRCISDTVSSYA